MADALGATFLRVDTVEAAVARSGVAAGDVPVGYVVASWVAGDQLRAGRPVVTDAVNDSDLARAGWHDLAALHGAAARFVGVVCSDAGEHRRRVESRTLTWPGTCCRPGPMSARGPGSTCRRTTCSSTNVGDPQPHVERIVAWLGA